jgi:hypothetical protein
MADVVCDELAAVSLSQACLTHITVKPPMIGSVKIGPLLGLTPGGRSGENIVRTERRETAHLPQCDPTAWTLRDPVPVPALRAEGPRRITRPGLGPLAWIARTSTRFPPPPLGERPSRPEPRPGVAAPLGRASRTVESRCRGQ